jgi:hypothetical protein
MNDTGANGTAAAGRQEYRWIWHSCRHSSGIQCHAPNGQAHLWKNMNRSMDFRFPLLLMLGLGAVAPAQAGTENSVMKLVEDGKILPLETIRRKVQAQVRGDYIGAEWDEMTWTYRLRFVDNGNVINVDVDARTGQRVRRTANY